MIQPAEELRLAESLLRVRLSQMLVNELLKQKAFQVPVHLALGHEAIAAAVAWTMQDGDGLLLPHRNIHYNIARAASLKAEVQELRLAADGVAGGWLGSMNMANPAAGIPYTSSILGNDLGVAAGVALAESVQGSQAVTFVVTGDGAMEEGAFYESLQFLKTYGLAAVVVVENNGWSLATTIDERRCPIHLDRLAATFDVPYLRLSGNDVIDYAGQLAALRQRALAETTPVVVEVDLATLGDWRMTLPDRPEGKFINYHHGAAPTVTAEPWPLIRESESDPVHVLVRRFGLETVRDAAVRVWQQVQEDAA